MELNIEHPDIDKEYIKNPNLRWFILIFLITKRHNQSFNSNIKIKAIGGSDISIIIVYTLKAYYRAISSTRFEKRKFKHMKNYNFNENTIDSIIFAPDWFEAFENESDEAKIHLSIFLSKNKTLFKLLYYLYKIASTQSINLSSIEDIHSIVNYQENKKFLYMVYKTCLLNDIEISHNNKHFGGIIKGKNEKNNFIARFNNLVEYINKLSYNEVQKLQNKTKDFTCMLVEVDYCFCKNQERYHNVYKFTSFKIFNDSQKNNVSRHHQGKKIRKLIPLLLQNSNHNN